MDELGFVGQMFIEDRDRIAECERIIERHERLIADLFLVIGVLRENLDELKK